MTRPAILIPDRVREIWSGNPQLDAQINAILRENQALLFQTVLSLQPSEAEFTAGVDWTPVMVGVVCDGTTFTKPGECSADAWDSSVYSTEGHLACAVSWRASQTDKSLMVGLNSDPTTDHDFDTIDYAIECTSSGDLWAYENGSGVDLSTSYTTSDQITISYDGLSVRYYKNATLLRTKPLVGARLFLDSSFFTSGGAVNSVSFGPITHVLANAVGWAADSQGKPAGLRQGFSSASTPDRATLTLVNGAARIAATSAPTSNEFCLPAIPVDPAKTYQITIRHSGTVASADGRYFRMEEYGSALPAGITHVANSGAAAEVVFVASTTTQDLVSNGAISTTPATDTFSYTPTSGTDFVSLGFFNFEPNTTTELIIEWAAMTELGSNVDLLPGVLPPRDTFDLNFNAATDVYQAADAGWASSTLDFGMVAAPFLGIEDVLLTTVEIAAGEAVEVVVQVLGGGTITENLVAAWTLDLVIKAGDTTSLTDGPMWRETSGTIIDDRITLVSSFAAADIGTGSKTFGLRAILNTTGQVGGSFDVQLNDVTIAVTHVKR